MPKYKYKAKSLEGEVSEGTYEAENHAQVLRMLRQRNFFPIAINRIPEGKDIMDFAFMSKVTVKDIAFFCRQFATLNKAGLPIMQVMEIMSKQGTNRRLNNALSNMAENVRKGRSLSDSMRDSNVFPELLINMVQTGELGGTLDKVLETMASHYEKDYKLKRKLKAAMTYPVFVLGVTFAVVYFLLTSVVPMFSTMFEGMGLALPLPTRMLLALSAFASSYGLLVITFLIFFGTIIKMFVSRGEGRFIWHRMLFRFPVVGKMQILVMTSRFAGTLATLLASGAPLIDSLEMTRKVIGNAVAERGIATMQERIRFGDGFWISLHRLNIFPEIMIHMVRVGEESGTLDDLLLSTSRFYEEESEGYMTKLTSLMEPAMILVLAGIVGFVVISIVYPMFGMMGQIG